MSCCCDQSGLSGLLAGLGDVSGRPVHIEAPFSLGVEVYNDAPWYSGRYGIDYDAIAAALNESDYVSGVSVYPLSGVRNVFIVIEGYSAQEYGRDSHLRNAILDVVDGVYGVQTSRGSARFEVETYDPQTGQTQTTRYDAPAGGSANPPSDVGIDFGAGIVDSISGALSVDRSTATMIGVGVGALALILVVGIVRR